MFTRLLYIGLFFLSIAPVWAAPSSTTNLPPTKSSSLVAIEHWTTTKGIKVFFVRTPDLPMLDIQVVFKAGSGRDDNKPGLAQFTNALLDEGTTKLSADQIAQQLDNVGAVYSSEVTQDMAAVGLRSLTEDKYLNTALQTFKQILTEPSFQSEAFNRVEKQILIALQDQLQQPAIIARKAFYKLLYDNQPYNHLVLGSAESIQQISLQDIKQFYKQYYVGKNAILAMVGDISTDKAKEIAENLTESLPEGEMVKPLPLAPSTSQTQQEFIHFPAQQTSILLGQVGITPEDPDYFALHLGNYVLGGGVFIARLFTQVREQKGLAYQVISGFHPLQARGPFAIFLQTRNEKAKDAIQLAKKMLVEFVQTGPKEAEINLSKKNITGGFALELASNSNILAHLIYIGFYGLPLDYLDTYRQKINAVTSDQIIAAFKHHIHPDSLVTVTVGQSVANADSNVVAKTQDH